MPDVQPLDERIARYERIMAMRGPDPENPLMTLEAIGDTFDPPLERERVRQIIAAGRPKRAGRPRSPDRLAEARRTLGVWEQRRARAATAGRSTATADRRIAALTAELTELGQA
jgi:hypothetical protein